MKVAFTLDDLPQWPMSYPPHPYTTGGIVDAIVRALEQAKIRGVYAFANSWSFQKHRDHLNIIDRWLSAGHHIANHTHNHRSLDELTTEDYIDEIQEAEVHLNPWLSKAPVRYFHHPLCAWGSTDEKRTSVKSFLAEKGYETAEVTNWLYEWRWNRAYINSLRSGDAEAIAFCKHSFLDYSVAQLKYDCALAGQWFGHEILGITLGHTLPFFADIAADLFCRLQAEGVEFISLEQAMLDPAYAAVASVNSDNFLVYHQKLAAAADRPVAPIVPSHQDVFQQITKMGEGYMG